MKSITKEYLIAIIKKSISDKSTVSDHVKGNITKLELESKGIKLAKPF